MEDTGPGEGDSLSVETETLLDEVTEELWQCPTRVRDDKTDEKPLREDEREVLSPLLNRGFEVVGTGLARVVVSVPDDWGLSGHVVKLGRFGDDLLSIGMWQNRNEVTVWADTVCEQDDANGEGLDTALMPVVHYQPALFRWLVMPEASPVPADEEEAAVETVKRRLAESPAELHSTEYQPVNVGLYGGEPRLIDYGRPHERSLRNFQSGFPAEFDKRPDG